MRPFPLLILLATCLAVLSCGKPPTLEGAWLGEGTYSVSIGSKPVKAQLEILKDGSYRYLILEPGILALTGVEKGSWKREGTTLVLKPGEPAPPEEDSSVLGALRRGSPKELRIKKLQISEDLKSLQQLDGALELEFRKNQKATAKLQKAGEI